MTVDWDRVPLPQPPLPKRISSWWWDTRLGWGLLRTSCRFGRHNVSCRGRKDHWRPGGDVIR